MTIRWFIKMTILLSMLCLSGQGCNINYEKRQWDNERYSERSGLSDTPNNDLNHKNIHDRIKNFKEQRNKGVFRPLKEGAPRRFFYRKYMKIRNEGASENENDIKEIVNSKQQQNSLNNRTLYGSQKFSNIISATNNEILHKSEKIFQGPFEEGLMLPNSGAQKNNEDTKNQKQNELKSRNCSPKTSKLNLNFKNITNKIFPNKKNINRYYFYKKLMSVNGDLLDNLERSRGYNENIMKKLNDGSLNDLHQNWKNKQKRERKHHETNNEDQSVNEKNKEYPAYVNLRETGTLEDLLEMSKYNGGDEEIYEEDDRNKMELHLEDNRRVRSCELKMEDLRESYMPNEQLSIYNPKLSIADQFVLSDTLF